MNFHDLSLDERSEIVAIGTRHCARYLADLTDRDLGAPSLLDGWTCAHLVAHLAFNASALCRLLDWAVTGIETPMYGSAEQRSTEIEKGAEHGVHEQRELFAHSAARLAHKWRELPAAAWSATVRTAQGRTVPASETLWMRTREVWIHAVDLASGATFSEIPIVVQSTLVAEIATGWRARGWSVDVGDLSTEAMSVAVSRPSDGEAAAVSGPLSAVLGWMTGRGASGLASPSPPDPPRWL